MSTLAEVRLWGTRVGAVVLEDGSSDAVFSYDPRFVERGIELAPLQMPADRRRYSFPALSEKTFRGLPGLLADSLPDKFGNALIDAWLATQGREPGSFNSVERLCYIGTRGMGALEYHPVAGPQAEHSEHIQISELADLASQVLAGRQELVAALAADDASRQHETMRQILSVGTSPGGARAKAVISWNPTTGEVRSGQVDAPAGFEHWLLKFDGVENNRDREQTGDRPGLGAIEYAYSLMARDAGIVMTETRLHEESGFRHFMTRRFDRAPDGDKLHMQTLGALAHLDRDAPNDYAQAFLTISRLELGQPAQDEMYRRMVFNVLARNHDDHTKNFSFLMDREGTWSLAPAYDLTYSYDPHGRWTAKHQLSVNGRGDDFTLGDLEAAAGAANLKRAQAHRVIDQVRGAVQRWPEHAAVAGVPETEASAIASVHRLDIVTEGVRRHASAKPGARAAPRPREQRRRHTLADLRDHRNPPTGRP